MPEYGHPPMRRRAFLGALGVTALGACTTRGPETTAGGGPSSGTSSPSPSPTPTPAPTTPPKPFGPPAGITKVPAPTGVITALPGEGNLIAFTCDDGSDPSVVAAYCDLCQRTGFRMTFFVNGNYPSWTDNKAALAPLVASGQVQLGNHTWSHADLRSLSKTDLAAQIQQNEQFLQETYGVTGQPFVRPPYGYHNATVDARLAELGYPTVTMWEGSLGDSSLRPSADILTSAQEWFLPQHIVIGHANHPPVIEVMDAMVELIVERQLVPVTLDDVFSH